jgi:hypothetical protein
VLIAALIASLAWAQLGPVVPISSGGNPEQAWAHANPSNPAYLIVCGNLRDAAEDLLAGYVYTSQDGGATWRRTLLENSAKFVSEESCAFGSHGTGYFIAGASNWYNGEPHHETGHMHFYTSSDGGSTWTHTWSRKDGWLDWTSIGVTPNGSNDDVVVFANAGTDRLGHWLNARPVAIDSQDGGRSFGNLISPEARGFQYVAVWTGENVTLTDGTILFATTASLAPPHVTVSDWGEHVAVEIFAYDPVSRRLSSRAVLRERNKVPIFTAAIAQDRGGGKFDGRIYAAWVESEVNSSALWFATSDDAGFHWHSRVGLSGAGWRYPSTCSAGAPVDVVELATAPDGRVGIAWVQNESEVRFSVSNDGGATFAHPITLARVDASQLDPEEAFGGNDYLMQAALDVYSGKSNPQIAWFNLHGLAIAVGPRVVTDLSLVADKTGRFHAFWASHVLKTRSIAVVDGDSGSATLGQRSTATCATTNAFRLAHPARPAAIPQIAVPGAREITSSIAMDIRKYSYDPVTHDVSIDGIVVNKSKKTLRGKRFILVGINAHSDIGDVRINNPQGFIDGQPYWDVTHLIPAGGLAPGAQSRPLHVTARIVNFRPIPSNYLSGDAVSFAVRLYAT